jgi:HAMP domain-containing protein
MDPKAQELGRHFVPIALLMAGATVLTLVVIAVLLNRTVLNRIARLEKNVKNVRDGNYAFDTLDAGSDEIGLLNASFWKWPIKSASTHKNWKRSARPDFGPTQCERRGRKSESDEIRIPVFQEPRTSHALERRSGVWTNAADGHHKRPFPSTNRKSG